jgi:inner membrane protease ATP23
MTIFDKYYVAPNAYQMLTTDKRIGTLVDSIEKAGCSLDPDFNFEFTKCHENLASTFDDERSTIVLCDNNIKSDQHLEKSLVRGLVRAYDHCRARVNWTDDRQLACSEIRAQHLSGNCAFDFELQRGTAFAMLTLRDTYQSCIKRQAAWNMMTERNMTSKEAHHALDAVFPVCVSDTSPFNAPSSDS